MRYSIPTQHIEQHISAVQHSQLPSTPIPPLQSKCPSSLGKEKLARQRKLQADSELGYPNSAPTREKEKKRKVKIKVTLRFQSRLEIPRFTLVLIRGLNQTAKLKLPGPLGILQLWNKILLKTLQV